MRVLGRNVRKDVVGGGHDRFDGACLDPTQVLRELGKGVLDRSAVGRVGGQQDQRAARRFNELAGAGALVHRQVRRAVAAADAALYEAKERGRDVVTIADESFRMASTGVRQALHRAGAVPGN